MKRILLLLPVLLFILVPTVTAQTPDRDEIRQRLLEQREDARQGVDTVGEEVTERVSERREEFRQRLETVGDEAQQRALERIDTKLQDVNQRVTAAFNTVLDKLENLVFRMEQRADTLAAGGEDFTSLGSALDNANQEIDTAKTIVDEQAQKEYIIDITDDLTLGDAARTAIEELRTDLKSARDAVMDAKNAVVEAARLLGQVNNNGQ